VPHKFLANLVLYYFSMATKGKGSEAEKKRAADALRSSGSAAKDKAGDDSDEAKHNSKHRKKDAPPAADDYDDFMEVGSEYATAKQMDAIMKQLTHNRDEDVRHRETLATMMASFENRFTISDAHLARVDDALAKVQSRLDDFDKRAPPPEGAGPSGSASSAGRSWAPSPSMASRSPTRSSPAAGPEYHKVFFVGADHALHRAVLGRYWNEILKPLVSASLTSGSKPFIGNTASFSVGFLTESAAKDFIIALEAVDVPPLVDPDDHSHSFTFHFQRTKVPTKFGKQLSYLHQHYHDKLCARDGYGTDFKLVTDAHRGRVYVERGERLFMLHTVNTDGATLRTFEDGLTEFKLDIAASRAAALLFAAV
jgi:hypothetical protein